MADSFQNVIKIYPPLLFTVTYRGVVVTADDYESLEADADVPRESPFADILSGEAAEAQTIDLGSLNGDNSLELSSLSDGSKEGESADAKPKQAQDAAPKAKEKRKEKSKDAKEDKSYLKKSGFFRVIESDLDSTGITSALHVILSMQLQRRRLLGYRDALTTKGRRFDFWTEVTGSRPEEPGFISKMFGIKNKFSPRDVELQKRFLELAAEYHEKSKIKATFEFEPRIKAAYEDLIASWVELEDTKKIWDVVSRKGTKIERKEVEIGRRNISEVESDEDSLHFVTSKGVEIYIYPVFVAVEWPDGRCAVMDLKSVEMRHEAISYPEADMVPSDAKILGQTYSGSASDGGKGTIPTVAYGEITLNIGTNHKERFLFSNVRKSESFVEKFEAYKNSYRNDTPKDLDLENTEIDDLKLI